jgi:hypothetical protein
MAGPSSPTAALVRVTRRNPFCLDHQPAPARRARLARGEYPSAPLVPLRAVRLPPLLDPAPVNHAATSNAPHSARESHPTESNRRSPVTINPIQLSLRMSLVEAQASGFRGSLMVALRRIVCLSAIRQLYPSVCNGNIHPTVGVFVPSLPQAVDRESEIGVGVNFLRG